MYNEELIREAVDIATGDDGRTSAEVIDILRILKQEASQWLRYSYGYW